MYPELDTMRFHQKLLMEVQGLELGVHGTSFREYGVYSFESTGFMVLDVLGTGYGVLSFETTG